MVVVNGFVPGDPLQNVWADIWDRHADKTNLHLVKLHGSVNWHSDAKNIVEIGGIQDRNRDRDVMIAPTEGAKDYARKPFPALMRHFGEMLEQVDVLLAIGFSFRDEAIVDKIKKRLDAGMVLISASLNPAEDICKHVSALTPEKVEDDLGLQTVGRNIILCRQKFGLENDALYPSLSKAYEISEDMLEKMVQDRKRLKV